MGNIYIQEHNYVKARDVFAENMTFAKNYMPVSQYADAIDDMANVLTKTGELVASKECEETAIQLLENNGILSMELAQYYSRYSTILEALNDIQGTIINKEKAIEMFGKLDLTKKQAIAWYELSVIYAKQERYHDAETSIRKAILLIDDDSKQSDYKELLLQYLYSQNKFEEIIFTARNEGDLKVPIKIKEGITFVIWEWCDWNVSQDRSIECVLENNKYKKKHVVLFGKGTLIEFETEENTIGLHIQSHYFDRESKQHLISQYTNWLKNKKK